MTHTCTLTLQCDDRPGLVADVAGFLAANGCNILDAQQFNDRHNGRFFMRVEFDPRTAGQVSALRADFAELATANGMEWAMRRR